MGNSRDGGEPRAVSGVGKKIGYTWKDANNSWRAYGPDGPLSGTFGSRPAAECAVNQAAKAHIPRKRPKPGPAPLLFELRDQGQKKLTGGPAVTRDGRLFNQSH
jgi:hypothetical protein